MKREVKFRGKRIDNNEWIEGFYGYKELSDEHFIIVPTFDQHSDRNPQYFSDFIVDGKTVGQFTGLKDIHGTEIFEGDIVKFMYNTTPVQTEVVGPVKWDERGLSWKFGEYYIEPTPRKTIEIIGHIYEVKETDNP